MHFLADGSGSAFFSNIGGILSGISELLVAVGAGVGFLIRARRGARRERLRAEAAATLAAQEVKKTLEAKLEAQYKAQYQQYEDQINQLKADNLRLQNANDRLIERLIGSTLKKEEN